MLLPARDAPRGPDVEQPDLSQHVLAHELLLRSVQLRELERRRRLADERGGHFPRLQVEADEEEPEQHHEHTEWEEEAIHFRTCYAACVAAVTVPSRVVR